MGNTLAYAYVCPKCGDAHASIASTKAVGDPIRVVCSSGCGYVGLVGEFEALTKDEFFKRYVKATS